MITITTTNEELDTVANNLNHIVKDGGEVVIKNKYGQSKYKKVGNKLIRIWQFKIKIVHLSYKQLNR